MLGYVWRKDARRWSYATADGRPPEYSLALPTAPTRAAALEALLARPGPLWAEDGPLPGAVVERVQVLTPETTDPLITVHLRTGQGAPAKLTGPGRAHVALTPLAQDFLTS